MGGKIISTFRKREGTSEETLSEISLLDICCKVFEYLCIISTIVLSKEPKLLVNGYKKSFERACSILLTISSVERCRPCGPRPCPPLPFPLASSSSRSAFSRTPQAKRWGPPRLFALEFWRWRDPGRGLAWLPEVGAFLPARLLETRMGPT